MITNHNYFHTFLLLIIHLLLSFTPIIGQHSSELESGVQIRCFENERQALLKFKREIVDEFGRLSTWEIEENKRDCCKWEGVYCNNRTNHVTQLDLRAPSEGGFWSNTPLQEVKYVNNLEIVKLVDLSNNNLAGEIPAEITKLDDLIGLNISRNNLIGSIPQNIGEMKALDFLDLSRNYLSGGIPTSLSLLSQLGILNLSYNNLSGKIPQNSHMLTFEESAYAGNPGLCGRPFNKSCPTNEALPLTNFNSKHEEEEENDDKLITQGFYIAMGAGFVVGFWGIFGTI